MSEKKSSNTLFKVYIALAILLSSAFWIFVMYSDVNYVEGSYAIPQADHPSVTSLELNVKNPTLGLRIEQLNASSDALYEVYWEYGSIGFQMNEMPEPIITNQTIGTQLQLNITIPDIEFTGEYMDLNYYSIYVYHDTELPIALNVDTDVGSVDISGKNIEYTQFDVSSTTGSVDVMLKNAIISNDFNVITSVGSIDVFGNDLNITGDVDVDTTTGSLTFDATNTKITGDLTLGTSVGSLDIDLTNVEIGGDKITLDSTTGSKSLYFNDIQFLQDVVIDSTGSTGSLDWTWDQTEPLNGNVSINADQSTGSIGVYLEFNDNIARLDVSGSASTGSVDIYGDPTLSSVGEDHYRSTNYGQNNLPLITMILTASTGSISVNADV